MRSNIGPAAIRSTRRSLAVAAGVLLAVASAAAAPAVEFEPRELDLGDVVRGESREGVFVVHNRGDEPLRLLRVKPGCGCTLADHDETIAPGESGTIRVSLETDTLRGDVARTIAVDTNDPQNRETVVLLRANVLTSVELLPGARARLSNVRPQTETARLVVRKNPSESGKLVIGDLAASVPWITATAREVTELRPAGAGVPTARPGDWLIELGFAEQIEYGSRNATVSFSTGLTHEPRITFPLGIVARPPLVVSSETMRVVPGQPVEPLLVRLRRGESDETLSVEAEPASIDVRVDATGPRDYRVALDWKGDRPAEGRLTLRVGNSTPYAVTVVREAAPAP